MKTLSIAWILDVLGLVLMPTKRRGAVHGSGRLARRAAFAMLLLAMLGVAGCATGARIGTGAFSQECGPGVGPCGPGLPWVDCGAGATCAVPPAQCCGGGVCGGGLVCSQTTSGPQCVTPGPGVGGASQPPPLQPFPVPPPQIGPPPIVYPPVPPPPSGTPAGDPCDDACAQYCRSQGRAGGKLSSRGICILRGRAGTGPVGRGGG